MTPASDSASAALRDGQVVVVSGSTGLIGTRLLAVLGASGYGVRRLVRRVPRGPNEIAWDPARGTIDAASLDGVDAVVHLAGETIAALWTPERKRRIRESRVRGTTLLATTLAERARPPRVLLSASAIGIYGNRGDDVLDESSAHGQGFLASVSEQWEAATEAASHAGIRVVNHRNGIVLARDGGMLAKLLPVFRLGIAGRVGSGRQWLSWIALSDLVAAMLFLLTADGVSGPVNMVAPNPVNNAELTRTLARVLRRPAILPVPATALSLTMGQMARETLLSSQRVRPKKLLDAGYEFALPTLETAIRTELARSSTRSSDR